MLQMCEAKRRAHQRTASAALKNTHWGGALASVQHGGYLDVPGVAACAMARCAVGSARGQTNERALLSEDMWDAAFSSVVHGVANTVGDEYSRAIEALISSVLDAGGWISGGLVVEAVCVGSASSQARLPAWSKCGQT